MDCKQERRAGKLGAVLLAWITLPIHGTLCVVVRYYAANNIFKEVDYENHRNDL